MKWYLSRTIGGYWEPAEQMPVGKPFASREAAEEVCEERNYGTFAAYSVIRDPDEAEDEAADAAERIECRLCGEVEPCSDRFLCATCQGRMDREDA